MFQKVTGDVEGPLEVKGALEIDGTLHGGAIVTGMLDLQGTCHGPLEVRMDGHADVEGVVHGDIHARGGKLRFRGILAGRLGVKPEADVLFAVGSILNGRRLEEDGSWTPVEGPFRFNIPDDAPMMRPVSDGTWVPAA
jgi:cytoskeletal protein CcmA (bactofilin family)